jgi:tRNA A-37 threonylcarbamoyl transferase component Bud32
MGNRRAGGLFVWGATAAVVAGYALASAAEDLPAGKAASEEASAGKAAVAEAKPDKPVAPRVADVPAPAAKIPAIPATAAPAAPSPAAAAVPAGAADLPAPSPEPPSPATRDDASAQPPAAAAGAPAAAHAPQMTLDQAAGLLGLDREGKATTKRSAAHGAGAEDLAEQVLEVGQFAIEGFPEFALSSLDDLEAGRLTQRAQILIGLASALLGILLVLVARAARGHGEIQVQLAYPHELKGTFTIRLSPRKSAPRPSRIKSPEDAARLGASTRTEHHMVARETSFRGVRPGTWYVGAEGFVQSESGEVISLHCEELEASVTRRQVTRLEFDFQPRACPLEVRIAWDRRPVEGALVARRGAPGSMRLARGPVNFSLGRGQHVLQAGHADRVSEVPVDIEAYLPRQLVIDLADREHLLFAGCPPAVAPYLNGDVPAAARCLERDGQTALANRLLARFHLEHDRKEAAARHFESAGEKREAAELWQSLTQFERAATLFEQAGDDERAAENFRSAGKLLRAGDAYARADAYDSAVECFRRAGDVPRWIEALEKKNAFFAAAQVALEHGDRARGLQCLHKVSQTDPSWPEAVARLVETHAAEGSLEIGLHRVDELIGTGRDSELPVERVDRMARLLEEHGAAERAIALLERLHQRDATWPGVATRVEGLKKRRSRDSALQAAAPGASAFSSEFRYEILEELGRGGMGIVFKARDRRLGRVVALKRLPDNLRNHPKAVELFLREARAAAALNHPNIVTLFDAGQEGETYYITMELLEGSPLQKILRQRGKLPAGHVVRLGGQVATGLQYAHEQGIVHRDIKTANLFFTDKKIVKIMDFGLAKMVEEVRRATTVIGGTPYYMAPEQGAGDAVDHRADLYALGVTFFELLTGSVPFREGDVTFHHRHTPPPDPRESTPDVPEALAGLVLEMLAKRPEQRIATAALVRARLQEIARSL